MAYYLGTNKVCAGYPHPVLTGYPGSLPPSRTTGYPGSLLPSRTNWVCYSVWRTPPWRTTECVCVPHGVLLSVCAVPPPIPYYLRVSVCAPHSVRSSSCRSFYPNAKVSRARTNADQILK